MVRKKTDPFWKYVDQRPNNRWKCNFCDNEYPGHVSRIKAHLGQVKNRGIDICGKVEEKVKKEALRALLKEAPDKEQLNNDRFVESSSSFKSILKEMEDCLLRDNDDQYRPGEASDPGGNEHSVQTSIQNEVNTMIGTENNLQLQNINELGANENSMTECTEFDQCLLTFKRKLKCLDNQQEEKEEELCQWSKKVKTIKGDYKKMKEAWTKGNHPSLEQLNQVKELVNRVEELGNLDLSEKETSRITPSPSALPLLTKKLIGRGRKISYVWNSLVSDGILRTGVCGMGGVGKTEIMMNIYNKLLNDKAFDNVFWVTVPKDFSVYELQAMIGNAMHLDELKNEKNEKIRAAMLNGFLTSGKKYVMILDGLWRSFDYYDVGIPLKYGDLKLVITCRSLNVLQIMHCGKMIRILPFESLEFDWDSSEGELFLQELGEATELPEEVDKIAGDIVVACDGLPLLVKAVATKMRGVENVRKWSDMMEKMNDFKERLYEMKGSVFDRLYLSYELLNNQELQQCLIFCAFYCSNRAYATLSEVKDFLVDIGLVDRTKSRKQMLDRVHNNIRELENACLLTVYKEEEEEEEEGEAVKMNRAIIDMALCVAIDTNLFKVDIGIRLLHEELQTEDLNEVSLMRDAKDETSKLSPDGIRLPIMITKSHNNLTVIPDSMFNVFFELEILDLSESRVEELPNSFSDLIKLTTLILKRCRKLNHIPNMEKLTSLTKLDLQSCENVEDLPDGFEYLVNLEYLDLSDTGIVELPEGALRTLKKLQYLSTDFIEARELEGLAKLESLCCMFSIEKDLTVFLDSIRERRHVEYFISVGANVGFDLNGRYKRRMGFTSITDMGRDVIFLTKNFSDCLQLENLEDLVIKDCKFMVIFGEVEDERYVTSNDGSGPSQIPIARNLQRIRVGHCDEFKFLIGPEAETRYNFPALREIRITECPQFQGINAAFPCLERIDISYCDEFKYLTGPEAEIRSNFPALQEIWITECRQFQGINAACPCLERIDISNCDELKYLIGPEAEAMYNFPALREIRITECRQFQGINAACPCVERIDISDCHEFKYLIGPEAETRYNFPALREISITWCRQFQGINAACPCLEMIDISDCDELEEIMAIPPSEMPNPTSIRLPNLKTLALSWLLELRSISAIVLDCPIETIKVVGCPKIKKIPVQMQELSNGATTPPSSLKKIVMWSCSAWESLEWESLEAKNALQPYLRPVC